MKEIFKERLNELNLSEKEKRIILKNIDLFTTIYFQGLKDGIVT